MTPDGAIAPTGDTPDEELLGALRAMWSERDPVPGDLAERVQFALSLEDLEVELLYLEAELLGAAGVRGEEHARTITFTSDSLSVMVSLSEAAAGVRLDGWISCGGGLRVGLRGPAGERLAVADEDGRFAFDAVLPGLAQLVFHPTEGAESVLARPVVTPAIQV